MSTTFAGFPRPQYTKTPNVIFDELMPNLSDAELRVLLMVVRLTEGWHVESDQISIKRVCEKTGVCRSKCFEALGSLEKRGFISRVPKTLYDGAKAANAYRLRFSGEDVTCGDPPSAYADLGTSVQADHPTSVQADVHKEVKKLVSKETNTFFPLPPSDKILSREDFLLELLRIHKNAKGAKSKKLDRPEMEEWLVRILGESDQHEILAALEVFLQDGFWRDKHFPLSAFRKQFQNYLGHVRNESYDFQEAEVQEYIKAQTTDEGFPLNPSVAPAANAPAQPIEAVEWSRDVAECPYIWNFEHDKIKPLIEARMKPYFVELFPEMRRIAAAIHRARGAEVGWLTFPWLLGKDKNGVDNAYKLVTTLAWMATPQTPKSGFGQPTKSLEAIQKLRADRKKEREEREKNAKNTDDI